MLQLFYRLCVETLVICRGCVFSGNFLINHLECASLGRFVTDESGKLIWKRIRLKNRRSSFALYEINLQFTTQYSSAEVQMHNEMFQTSSCLQYKFCINNVCKDFNLRKKKVI